MEILLGKHRGCLGEAAILFLRYRQHFGFICKVLIQQLNDLFLITDHACHLQFFQNGILNLLRVRLSLIRIRHRVADMIVQHGCRDNFLIPVCLLLHLYCRIHIYNKL